MGTDKNGRLITGFYAGRTHSIIENTHCYIQAEVNEQILETVLGYCRRNHISAYDEKTGKGVLRHILTRVGFRTGEIMVCLIINANKKKMVKIEGLVEELTKIDGMTSITLNINRERTNRILGDKIVPVWGQTYNYRLYRQCSISDQSAFLLSGESEADGSVIWKSTGICGFERRRNGMGSVLRNWNDLSFSGAESEKGLRSGNRAAGD